MKEILSKREKEIAELVTWGASCKEISCILNISVETVKEHIKHIKRKLGIINQRKLEPIFFVLNMMFLYIEIGWDESGILWLQLLVCLLLFLSNINN